MIAVKEFVIENWLALLSIVIGVVVSYYFYRKSIRAPQILFKTSTLTLLRGVAPHLPKDLRVEFRGEVIETLRKTWLILWNAGTGELRSANISDNQPIAIRCVDGRILEAKIVSRTNLANAVELGSSSGSSEVPIDFSYFNAGDGIRVEVLHTGTTSRIDVKGELIGADQVRRAGLEQDTSLASTPAGQLQRERLIWPIAAVVMLGFVGANMLGTTFGLFNASELIFPSLDTPVGRTTFLVLDWVFYFIGIVIGALALAFAVALVWLILQRRPPKVLCSAQDTDGDHRSLQT